MKKSINLLDMVALTEDLTQHKLFRGQEGVVVEILAPDIFKVEFRDEDDQTYSTLPLRANQLMELHYHLVEGDGQ